jgi:PTH1 family peptidyl-tRNA hydrolase
VVERFLADNSLTLRRAPRSIAADIAEVNVLGVRAVIAKPRTFMNESARAVAPLVKYFGVPMDRLLVVHDDIDVPFGKLKVQDGGGHGGNNGVRSIVGTVGKEFWRLKVGVGRPPAHMDPADFVLGRFAKAEQEQVDIAVYRGADVVHSFISGGGEEARQYAGQLND